MTFSSVRGAELTSVADSAQKEIREPSLEKYDGLIIDSIYIVTRNVYDTTQSGQSGWLFRTANKLHTITRKSVIERELLLAVGGVFYADLARETARNLRTRFELYDARFRVRLLENSHLALTLETIDQWSTFSHFSLSRESDNTTYRFGVEERNLAGHNQQIVLDYFAPGDETDYLSGRFSGQRFFGEAFSLDMQYSDNPIMTIRHLGLVHPFYNLAQRYSYGLAVSDIQGRRDAYFDATRIAQSQRIGDRLTLFGSYRWGTRARKLGLRVEYEYGYEKTLSGTIIKPELLAASPFASDSIYHLLSVGPTYEEIRFLRLQQINGLGYPEDFTLGREYSISFGRAYDPGFDGFQFDRIKFAGSESSEFGSNLAILDYEREYWVKDSKSLQRTTNATLRWYNYRFDFLTVAFRANYQRLKRAAGGDLLQLGGLTGLRGYDKFYRTGNARLVLNLETRFFSSLELLSVLFGGVLFADAGRVWKDPASASLIGYDANPGWKHSIGAGLRISMEKASRSQVIRIDFARAQDGQWQLLAGTGQYF